MKAIFIGIIGATAIGGSLWWFITTYTKPPVVKLENPVVESSEPLAGAKATARVELSLSKQNRVLELETIYKTRPLDNSDGKKEFDELWALAAEKAKLNGGYQFKDCDFNNFTACLINYAK